MRITRILLLGLWLVTSHGLQAQRQRTNAYHLEAGGLVASDQTPFWLRANQYGTVPLNGSIARFSAGLKSDYRAADSTGYRPKIDWGYGLDVVANAGATNQVLVPEAYIKGRLGAFELYAGRRRELVGLVDTLLTTGAYAWSGNALPIPKIQIGVPTFTSIPFTRGIISFLGAYSHGWFENTGRQITGSFLHQKYLYGRLGKTTWPFRLYAGFNHQVIWAGQAAPGVLSPNVAVNGQLPSTLRYYPAVVLGSRGNFQNDNVVTSFEENRIGNHLGSVDLAADADIGSWNVYVYRQFLYDDGSLFYGTNIADGLNGLRLKNRNTPAEGAFSLRQITFEYLFTGSQGGDEFVIDDDRRRGRDNYFNHSQFVDGWVYFSRAIGTPFLTPSNEVRPSLNSGGPIGNNRVSAYHLGVSALLFGTVDVTTRLSYSINAGTYPSPYLTLPTQFSGLLTASVPLNILGGTTLNGSLALDSGGLLPNSVGAYLGLRKSGLFSRPANSQAARSSY
ncbi:capsule assembly Wzi family protein [Spirosoma sordidisoli]|uniref:Capsule assembly Wzi family protein n=1 Tax=Spirosoma sordidisoli TaxID=2502893 RepID=A0A4Q2ULI5_9BACT|nr:capsule assembly Wzi family protein [Spirosoma sordidisoli]RYC68551.1 hypothetical protein EQG79_19590 [Spirosoma sordidisoli]